MREFARTEIIREKCHICGCKNKLKTPLINNYNVIGMNLRCCNCGRTITYINPEITDHIDNYLRDHYMLGTPSCIQESYCPHKMCRLYGTCGGSDKLKPPCNIEGCTVPCYINCGHPCEYYYKNIQNGNCCVNDFPNSSELTINEIKGPKFK